MIGFVNDVVFVGYLEINQFQRKQDERYDDVLHCFFFNLLYYPTSE